MRILFVVSSKNCEPQWGQNAISKRKVKGKNSSKTKQSIQKTSIWWMNFLHYKQIKKYLSIKYVWCRKCPIKNCLDCCRLDYYEGIWPIVRKKNLKMKSLPYIFSFPPNYCIPEKKFKHFYRIQIKIQGPLILKQYLDMFFGVDMPKNHFKTPIFC